VIQSTESSNRIEGVVAPPQPRSGAQAELLIMRAQVLCPAWNARTSRCGGRSTLHASDDFSKKIENHAAAVALYLMYYNFGRVNQTLRVTPVMEAGVTGHVWSVEEIAGLLEAR
jgi:hypothetical protein